MNINNFPSSATVPRTFEALHARTRIELYSLARELGVIPTYESAYLGADHAQQSMMLLEALHRLDAQNGGPPQTIQTTTAEAPQETQTNMQYPVPPAASGPAFGNPNLPPNPGAGAPVPPPVAAPPIPPGPPAGYGVAPSYPLPGAAAPGAIPPGAHPGQMPPAAPQPLGAPPTYPGQQPQVASYPQPQQHQAVPPSPVPPGTPPGFSPQPHAAPPGYPVPVPQPQVQQQQQLAPQPVFQPPGAPMGVPAPPVPNQVPPPPQPQQAVAQPPRTPSTGGPQSAADPEVARIVLGFITGQQAMTAELAAATRLTGLMLATTCVVTGWSPEQLVEGINNLGGINQVLERFLTAAGYNPKA